jgi:Bifunctional DNA primase/polymerase, N-terminal/AAA domain
MNGLHIPVIDPGADTLTAALAYAEAGWYVGPLKVGTKHPGSVLGDDWDQKTSRNPEIITGWCTGRDDLGVFLHVGRSGGWVADIDKPAKVPDVLERVIARWCEPLVPFQATRPTTDPARGHYVFTAPPGRKLGNSTGRLGGGWGEARGRNGVIVAWPTPHAGRGRYLWRSTGPCPVLPDEVATLLPDAGEVKDAVTDEELTAFLKAHVGSDRPTLLVAVTNAFTSTVAEGKSRHDAARDCTCWAMREAACGFYPALEAADTLRDLYVEARRIDRTGGRDGVGEHVARDEFQALCAWAVGQVDGENLDELRAKINQRAPDTNARIGNRLEERRNGVSTKVDTDDEERDTDSWEPVDLTDAVQGKKVRMPPSILRRSDGMCMFYEGQINYLHGADGVGKSWVGLFASKHVLDEGGHVVWLDWEDPDEVTIVGRLLDLGVAPDVILERFHYHHPETEATKPAVAKITDLIRAHGARLVVVDSIGEAFGLDGIGENNDDEVAPWMRRVLRPLAATGAGVLPVDHSIKSGDNPLHPSGSKRKRATVTGSHFLVEATRPISKEYRGGQLKLTCAKDRHGNFTRGKAAALIDIAIYPDGGWTVHVHPPVAPVDEAANNDRVLARAMVRLVKDLAHETQTMPSMTLIEQSKRVRGGVQAKRAAVEYAAACGALREHEGPRNARLFEYLKDLDISETTTPSDPVTTPSDGVTEPTSPTPSPRPALGDGVRDGVDGATAEEQPTPTPSDGANTTWLTDLVSSPAYQRGVAKAAPPSTPRSTDDP